MSNESAILLDTIRFSLERDHRHCTWTIDRLAASSRHEIQYFRNIMKLLENSSRQNSSSWCSTSLLKNPSRQNSSSWCSTLACWKIENPFCLTVDGQTIVQLTVVFGIRQRTDNRVDGQTIGQLTGEFVDGQMISFKKSAARSRRPTDRHDDYALLRRPQ